VSEFAGRSDTGRVRENNEDRYLAMRRGRVTLLAVADGVGGEDAGEVASAAAIDGLASAFDFGAPDIAAALGSAVRAANDAVLRATSARGHPTAASTLVAAIVSGRRCAVANLGDSRAYLVRAGASQQITSDHTGSISNSITRFVGDPRGVAPDVFTETLRARDRLVLCSDGLTRHVPPAEIARAAVAASPARAAGALIDLANARGGEDNVTVIVYRDAAFFGPLTLAVLSLIVALAALGAIVTAFAPSSSAPSTPPAETSSPTATP
jgi:serine/threonine protein phosphatase PrpC